MHVIIRHGKQYRSHKLTAKKNQDALDLSQGREKLVYTRERELHKGEKKKKSLQVFFYRSVFQNWS